MGATMWGVAALSAPGGPIDRLSPWIELTLSKVASAPTTDRRSIGSSRLRTDGLARLPSSSCAPVSSVPGSSAFRSGQTSRRGRWPVSYTHLRAHETDSYLVCRLLLE